MEEWKDVPGYEGLYQISIDTKEGKCKSLRTGKILSNKPNKIGRLNWVLYKEGKPHSQQAGRWIALTYPELIANEWFYGAQIDHINTDPLDNNPKNLRWVTPIGQQNNPLTKEHIRNSRIGKCLTERTKSKLSKIRKGKQINRKDQSKPVSQYTTGGDFIATYQSIREAERKTNIDNAQISACCLNKPKHKTAGGFVWKYA